MVESDLVRDVQSCAPSVTSVSALSASYAYPPKEPQTSELHTSAGDKRKHGDTMSVTPNPVAMLCTGEVSTKSNTETEMARWDQRSVTLKGLQRKSCVRYVCNDVK